MMALSMLEMPKPFRLRVSKCLSRRSLADSRVNTQSSSSKVRYLDENVAAKRWRLLRSISTSLGEKLTSSLSTYSSEPSAVRNSPVLMSRNDTPSIFLPKWTAASQLFSLRSSIVPPTTTPGVTSSVMPRLTSFLVSLGSSS